LYINSKKSLSIFTALSVFLLGIFFVFVRYGGAFNYANSITWESAARLKSNLLNEAILDDAQALYRVRSMYKRSQKAINTDISADEIKKQIEILGGYPSADTIDEAFKKEIKERKLAKPQNVIFILGETYALWPFLREYQKLGLVHKGLEFQNSPNSLSTDMMLAQGSGTMPTLNGLLSGLSDVGIYENYEKESFKNSYAMGIGAVMKGLGYKTVFWYGGFDGWQNIKNFVYSQSFDEFHSSSEFKNKDGNSWGVTDRFLFRQVEEYIKADDGQKVFHFILTTSNHPPYSIDVASEGFNKDKVKKLLPPSIPNDEKTLNELGHIWYADNVMGNFVEDIQDNFPDTLFVITGDHSERFSFAQEMDAKTLSGVPCIFYAHGIDKSAFVFNKTGTHLQIIPTLAELIGDNGDRYSSIFPSLFDDAYGGVFNHKLWADKGEIGKLENAPQDIENRARAARAVTIYRVKKGNDI
jgi:phosphoglycerol transferase MdoB-like AlkP superfamily enzyme